MLAFAARPVVRMGSSCGSRFLADDDFSRTAGRLTGASLTTHPYTQAGHQYGDENSARFVSGSTLFPLRIKTPRRRATRR
jgi:hypothetical protein